MRRNAQTRLKYNQRIVENLLFVYSLLMTKLDELHAKFFREYLLSSIFMTSQVGLYYHQKKETFSNLLNNYV